ncbi:MAG: hypothetical protein BWY79_00408 [Actinobacteria bacterium ADurb.Bin444]|nr:MAG: hypothetical protein BWY79_00408 [Actinobacteria bacterium ADurb.Bin444]
MKANTALARPERVVVLNAKAAKHMHLAVVHAHGDAYVVLTHRLP